MKAIHKYISEHLIKGHTISQQKKHKSQDDLLEYSVYAVLGENTNYNTYFLATSNNPTVLGININDLEGESIIKSKRMLIYNELIQSITNREFNNDPVDGEYICWTCKSVLNRFLKIQKMFKREVFFDHVIKIK